MPDDMFTLAKWYLDLITDDGTAIIGYAASLESRRVRVGYSSVLTSIAGAAACESSAFGQAGFPSQEDTLVTWQPPALSRPLGSACSPTSDSPPPSALPRLDGAATESTVHGVVQNLFRVGRHLLRAVHHHVPRARAFVEWDTVTCACVGQRHSARRCSLVRQSPVLRVWIFQFEREAT
jgi:hypothetical protein